MHRLSAAILILIVAFACTKKSGEAIAPTPGPDAQMQLAMRGQSVYMSRCIACHNVNPNKPGSLGPEIHGASLELLRARVIEGKYPEGYKPKRDTKLMVPIKEVEPDLPALHAFLNQ